MAGSGPNDFEDVAEDPMMEGAQPDMVDTAASADGVDLQPANVSGDALFQGAGVSDFEAPEFDMPTGEEVAPPAERPEDAAASYSGVNLEGSTGNDPIARRPSPVLPSWATTGIEDQPVPSVFQEEATKRQAKKEIDRRNAREKVLRGYSEDEINKAISQKQDRLDNWRSRARGAMLGWALEKEGLDPPVPITGGILTPKEIVEAAKDEYDDAKNSLVRWEKISKNYKTYRETLNSELGISPQKNEGWSSWLLNGIAMTGDYVIDSATAEARLRMRDAEYIMKAPIDRGPQVNWMANYAQNAAKALTSTAGNAVDGIGQTYGYAAMVAGIEKTPDQNQVSLFGKWIADRAEELYPGDPARQHQWATLMGQGTGSMMFFLGTGGAAQGLSVLALPRLGALSTKFIGMGATGLAGSLPQAAQMSNDALAAAQRGVMVDGKPITQGDRAKAFLLGWPIGLTEMVGVPRSVFGSSSAFASATHRHFFRELLAEMAEEGGQEMVQSFLENAVARQLYDPERRWDDSVWSGGVVGMALGGYSTAVREAKIRSSTRTDESPPLPKGSPGDPERPPEEAAPTAPEDPAVPQTPLQRALARTSPMIAQTPEEADKLRGLYQSMRDSEDPETRAAAEWFRGNVKDKDGQPLFPATGTQQDPSGFSVRDTYAQGGAEGLSKRLDGIAETKDLQALAEGQGIELPDALRAADAPADAVRAAIVSGAQTKARAVDPEQPTKVSPERMRTQLETELEADTAFIRDNRNSPEAAEKVREARGRLIKNRAALRALENAEERIADAPPAPEVAAPEAPAAPEMAQPEPTAPEAPNLAPEAIQQPMGVEPQQEAAAPAAAEPQTRKIITPDGSMEIEATSEIVELADLKQAEGDLQPRNPDSAESLIGIGMMAAQNDPEQLQPNRVSDTGAPIVNAGGTILSGNRRTRSIAEVYRNPRLAAQAVAYRESLGPRAKGFKEPVLIMRVRNLSRQDQVAFADLSNRARIADMTATERAVRDADRAGPEIMGLYRGGDLESAANKPFRDAFTAATVSPQEQGSFTRDGRLSRTGVDRMNAALLAAAYGDGDLLAMMLESTDDNVRAITNAMREAAGHFVRLKADIEAGIVPERFDVSANLVDAVKLISDLRRRGVTPKEFFDQPDLYDIPDPITEMFIRAFYRDDLRRAQSQQKISATLIYYAEEASRHHAQGLLEDPTIPQEIIRLAGQGGARADAQVAAGPEGAVLGSPDQSGNGSEGRPDVGGSQPAGVGDGDVGGVNPGDFQLVKMLRDGGLDALIQRLSEVASVDDLLAIAKLNNLFVPADARGSTADVAQAMAAGAERRLSAIKAGRDQPLTRDRSKLSPQAERLAENVATNPPLRQDVAEKLGPEAAEQIAKVGEEIAAEKVADATTQAAPEVTPAPTEKREIKDVFPQLQELIGSETRIDTPEHIAKALGVDQATADAAIAKALNYKWLEKIDGRIRRGKKKDRLQPPSKDAKAATSDKPKTETLRAPAAAAATIQVPKDKLIEKRNAAVKDPAARGVLDEFSQGELLAEQVQKAILRGDPPAAIVKLQTAMEARFGMALRDAVKLSRAQLKQITKAINGQVLRNASRADHLSFLQKRKDAAIIALMAKTAKKKGGKGKPSSLAARIAPVDLGPLSVLRDNERAINAQNLEMADGERKSAAEAEGFSAEVWSHATTLTANGSRTQVFTTNANLATNAGWMMSARATGYMRFGNPATINAKAKFGPNTAPASLFDPEGSLTPEAQAAVDEAFGQGHDVVVLDFGTGSLEGKIVLVPPTSKVDFIAKDSLGVRINQLILSRSEYQELTPEAEEVKVELSQTLQEALRKLEEAVSGYVTLDKTEGLLLADMGTGGISKLPPANWAALPTREKARYRRINGVYYETDGAAKRVIALSTMGKLIDVLATLSHEDIHALRRLGVINEDTWSKLSAELGKKIEANEALRIIEARRNRGYYGHGDNIDGAKIQQLQDLARAGQLTYMQAFAAHAPAFKDRDTSHTQIYDLLQRGVISDAVATDMWSRWSTVTPVELSVRREYAGSAFAENNAFIMSEVEDRLVEEALARYTEHSVYEKYDPVIIAMREAQADAAPEPGLLSRFATAISQFFDSLIEKITGIKRANPALKDFLQDREEGKYAALAAYQAAFEAMQGLGSDAAAINGERLSSPDYVLDPMIEEIQRQIYGESYSFAGEGAVGAPGGSRAAAEVMKRRGGTAQQIWQATGWIEGADGFWRFEIDDSGAKFNPKAFNDPRVVPKQGFVSWLLGRKAPEAAKLPRWTLGPVALARGAVGDILDHPELFKHYPRLKNMGITILIGKYLPDHKVGGSLSYSDKVIGPIKIVAQSEAEALDTLMHEVQHYIQVKERWPGVGAAATEFPRVTPGGTKESVVYSPKTTRALGLEEIADPATLPYGHRPHESLTYETPVERGIRYLERAQEDLDEAKARGEPKAYIDRIEFERDQLQESIRRDLHISGREYLRDTGEGEANETMRRRRMTTAERRAAPPSVYANEDKTAVALGKPMTFRDAADEVAKKIAERKAMEERWRKPVEVTKGLTASRIDEDRIVFSDGEGRELFASRLYSTVGGSDIRISDNFDVLMEMTVEDQARLVKAAMGHIRRQYNVSVHLETVEIDDPAEFEFWHRIVPEFFVGDVRTFYPEFEKFVDERIGPDAQIEMIDGYTGLWVYDAEGNYIDIYSDPRMDGWQALAPDYIAVRGQETSKPRGLDSDIWYRGRDEVLPRNQRFSVAPDDDVRPTAKQLRNPRTGLAYTWRQAYDERARYRRDLNEGEASTFVSENRITLGADSQEKINSMVAELEAFYRREIARLNAVIEALPEPDDASRIRDRRLTSASGNRYTRLQAERMLEHMRTVRENFDPVKYADEVRGDPWAGAADDIAVARAVESRARVVQAQVAEFEELVRRFDAESIPRGKPFQPARLMDAGNVVLRAATDERHGAVDGTTVYYIHRHPGVDIATIKTPSKVLDKPIGAVTVDHYQDGRWEVAYVEIHKDYRNGEKAGYTDVAKNAYSAIEKDTGHPAQPSGILLGPGYGMWLKRDPASVRFHRDIDGVYMSPKYMRAELERSKGTIRYWSQNANDAMAQSLIEDAKRKIGKIERALAKLPDEAFDPAIYNAMFSMAGDLAPEVIVGAFYSPTEHAVNANPLDEDRPNNWMSFIKKTLGPEKMEEVEWIGLKTWLVEKKDKVSKADILKFLADNKFTVEVKELGAQPKAFQMEPARTQLGREKREYNVDMVSATGIASTWRVVKEWKGAWVPWVAKLQDADNIDDLLTSDFHMEATTLEKLVEKLKASGAPAKWGEHAVATDKAKPSSYREMLIRVPRTDMDGWLTPHFSDTEVLHLRYDEREGPNGERVMYLHELQSDLHQKGREEGYRSSPQIAEAKVRLDEVMSQLPDARKAELDSESDFTSVAMEMLKAHNDLYNSNHEYARAVAWQTVDGFFNPMQGPTHGVFGDANEFIAKKLAEFKPEYSVLVKEWAEKDAVSYAARNQMHKLRDERDVLRKKIKDAIPDAPFKEGRHIQLGLKAALRYAAENGFDGVAWSRSDQIARVVGALPITALEVEGSEDGKTLTIVGVDGKNNTSRSFKRGTGRPFQSAIDFVRENVNAETAEQISKAIESGDLSKFVLAGFSVPNFGMQNQYDKQFRKFLTDYTKQWGAKIGRMEGLTDSASTKVDESDSETHVNFVEAVRNFIHLRAVEEGNRELTFPERDADDALNDLGVTIDMLGFEDIDPTIPSPKTLEELVSAIRDAIDDPVIFGAIEPLMPRAIAQVRGSGEAGNRPDNEYIDITPDMRQSVMKGQSLYSFSPRVGRQNVGPILSPTTRRGVNEHARDLTGLKANEIAAAIKDDFAFADVTGLLNESHGEIVYNTLDKLSYLLDAPRKSFGMGGQVALDLSFDPSNGSAGVFDFPTPGVQTIDDMRPIIGVSPESIRSVIHELFHALDFTIGRYSTFMSGMIDGTSAAHHTQHHSAIRAALMEKWQRVEKAIYGPISDLSRELKGVQLELRRMRQAAAAPGMGGMSFDDYRRLLARIDLYEKKTDRLVRQIMADTTDYNTESLSKADPKLARYLTLPQEMPARAFEAYVALKAERTPGFGDLARLSETAVAQMDPDINYPKGRELERISKAFDAFFEEVKFANVDHVPGAKGYMAYSVAPDVGVTTQPTVETFDIGVDGMNAFMKTVPPRGKSGKENRWIYVFPDAVDVDTKSDIAKEFKDYGIGRLHMTQEAPGKWLVQYVSVNEGFRGRGIARSMYDSVERALGTKMSPSGYLQPDGYEFWKKRNPDLVQWHVQGSKEIFNENYLSPKTMRTLFEANEILIETSRQGLQDVDPRELRLAAAENAELMKMMSKVDWASIPDRLFNEMFSSAGSDEINLTTLISNLKAALKMTVTQGRRGISLVDPSTNRRAFSFRPKANVLAQYERDAQAARVKSVRDIQTIGHEGGHHLETVLGPAIAAFKAQYGTELAAMNRSGGGDPVSEGFAEFFRRYILEPKALPQGGLTLVDEFESILDIHDNKNDTNFLRDFLRVREEWAQYSKLTASERATHDLGTWRDKTGWEQFKALWGSDERFSDKLVQTGYWFLHLRDQLSVMGLDKTKPILLTEQKLMRLADETGIRDAKGRPISIATGKRPSVIARMMPGSVKAGHMMIMEGVPDYHGFDAKTPALHEAMTTALGSNKSKDWSEEGLQKFGAYLVARHAEDEQKRWDAKVANLKFYENQIIIATNTRKVAKDTLDKVNGRMQRRRDAVRAQDVRIAQTERELARLRAAEKVELDRIRNTQTSDQNRESARVRLRRHRVDIRRVTDELTDQFRQRTYLTAEVAYLEPRVQAAARAYRQSVEDIDALEADQKRVREAGLQRAPTQYTMAELQSQIQQFEAEYPGGQGKGDFKAAAEMVYDWTQGLLKYEHQAGFWSPEQYAALSKRRTYVPFLRTFDDGGPDTGMQGVPKPSKRFAGSKRRVGSDREIVNPLEALTKRAYDTAASVMFNDMVKGFDELVGWVGPSAHAIMERVTKEELVAADKQMWNRLKDELIARGMSDADATIFLQSVEHNWTASDAHILQSVDNLGPNRPLTVPLWENGERKMVRINDPELGKDLWQAMNAVGRENASSIAVLLAKPAQWLRAGVTTHPAFVLPNIMRDMIVAWKVTGAPPILTQMRGLYYEAASNPKVAKMLSAVGITPPRIAELYNRIGGISGGIGVAGIEGLKNEYDLSEMRRRGGGHVLNVGGISTIALATAGSIAGVALAPALASGTFLGIATGMAGFYLGSTIGGLTGRAIFGPGVLEMTTRLSEMSETATRIGVFAHAMKKARAYDPNITEYDAIMEAAFTARDLLDFDRNGSHMVNVTKTIAFLNANLQGYSVVVRKLISAKSDTDRGRGTIDLMGKFLANAGRKDLSPSESRWMGEMGRRYIRMMIAAFLGVMLYASQAHDPVHKDIKQDIKAKHYIFNSPWGWNRWPKEFEMALPTTIGEVVYDWYAENDPRLWSRVWESGVANLSPPWVPNAMSIYLGARHGMRLDENGNLQKIVPDNLAKLPSNMQIGANTSQLAIDISNASKSLGLELSPMKIDFVLTSGFGYWGREAQTIANYAANRNAAQEGIRWTDQPILGTVVNRMTLRPAQYSAARDQMYEMISQGRGEYSKAFAGYESILKVANPLATKDYLDNLKPEERIYAVLMKHFSKADQVKHPTQRASVAAGVSMQMLRELATYGHMDDSRYNDRSKFIKPTEKEQVMLKDMIERLSATEAINGLKLAGKPGYVARDAVDPQLVLNEIQALNADVYRELKARREKAGLKSFNEDNADWQAVEKRIQRLLQNESELRRKQNLERRPRGR